MTLGIIEQKRFSVSEKIPHPIPYQGSKRNLATKICALFPKEIDTFFEPFAGSAAVTLFAARNNLANRFVVGDSLSPLIKLWREIVEKPEETAHNYEKVWMGQTDKNLDYFNKVRERFNTEGNPIDLLYLTARCVKNAVRFNKHGKFTQSVDKRRLGTHPGKMKLSICGASELLKGKVEFICGDFKNTISTAKKNDFIYLDPPYEGTTTGRDKRYFSQVERSQLITALADLNNRFVPFVLSYDGTSGDVVYGEELPEHLGMRRLLIEAGRSSQATLNGRNRVTFESLYVSQNIQSCGAVKYKKTIGSDLLIAA